MSNYLIPILFTLFIAPNLIKGLQVDGEAVAQRSNSNLDQCPGEDSLAKSCKGGRLWVDCWDCDTRNNHECGDPTLDFKPPVMKLKPNVKECSGCCFTLIKNMDPHQDSDEFAYLRRGYNSEQWIKRGCSDDYKLNLNFTGQCVNLEGGETLCYCDSDHCNGGNQTKSVCSGGPQGIPFKMQYFFLTSIFMLILISN